MRERTKTSIVGLALTGTVQPGRRRFATPDDDATNTSNRRTARDRATQAAVVYTGGREDGTEVGDEEGYYEVEVRVPDGRQADDRLDQTSRVGSFATDSENDG